MRAKVQREASTEGGKYRGRQVKCVRQAASGLDAIIQTQEAREEPRCIVKHKHILCATGKHRYFQIKTTTHKKETHTHTHKKLPLFCHGLSRCCHRRIQKTSYSNV